MRRAAPNSVTVTFLEMRTNPYASMPAPGSELSIVRARNVPIHFYRYLYGVIGEAYMWVDRARLDDRALAEIIHHPDAELYVLYSDGAPAGYAELSFHEYPDVELVHFGLVPEATGRGLGRYFLSEIVTHVWSRSPNRFHVQTCTLDHPAALGLYKECGFVPFAEVVKDVEELA